MPWPPPARPWGRATASDRAKASGPRWPARSCLRSPQPSSAALAGGRARRSWPCSAAETRLGVPGRFRVFPPRKGVRLCTAESVCVKINSRQRFRISSVPLSRPLETEDRMGRAWLRRRRRRGKRHGVRLRVLCEDLRSRPLPTRPRGRCRVP